MRRDSRRRAPLLERTLAAFCALAFLHQSAVAQVYAVLNTNGGYGTNSFATQVTASNGSPGNNTVDFETNSAGTIALAENLGINGNTTLNLNTSAGGAVTLSQEALSLNGAVFFSNANLTTGPVFSINSTLAGAGSLTVSGNGIVALTVNPLVGNSYTGGTSLNSGILNVNSDLALGNTGGGLTFNGGTLQAAAGLTSARTITLNANGIFDPNGFTSSFSGLISGTGQLVVNDSSIGGDGIMVLTNTGNSYSGGTYLESGTLSVGADTMLGTGGLTFNGGTLQTGTSLTDSRNVLLNSLGGVFDTAGTTSTFSGLISGGGALTKISSGTLILSGANTYTGGTVIKGGVLGVYNDANLGGASGGITLNGGVLQTLGALATDRGVTLGASGGTIDTYGKSDSFYGVIGGAGALTVADSIGGGVLTLGAVNTYSGATFVNAGTLQMGADNVLPGGNNMTVAGGATFNMNGFSQSIALGNVTNNGLISVGPLLNMSGTYSGTGTLALTLQPATPTTPIVTAGTMNLNNTGTLAVKLSNPAVTNHETFTAITATTINGQFANVLSPAAVSFAPTYNAGSIVLTATLVPFASLAASPNQAAVGSALESLRTQAQSNPAGAAGTVIGNLYTLNASQIQSAFDQLGPIALASMSSLGLAGSSVQSEVLARRMTVIEDDAAEDFSLGSINGLSAGSGALLAAGGLSETDPSDKALQNRKKAQGQSGSPWSFFASGVGTSGRLSALDGPGGAQPGYDYRNEGFVLGGDYRISDKTTVGLSAGYLYGHSNVYTAQESAVDNNSARFGVYAARHAGDFRADLYAGGAFDFFSTNRGILFGASQQDATASPTGTELNANADFSYDFDTDYGFFSPFAGINEDRLMINSFSESGAGAMDLNVGSQTDQSLRSSLGVRQTASTQTEGLTLRSHWSLGWVHEYMDQSRPIDAQFSSGAGSVFTVQTAGLPRDGALVGLGAVVGGDETSVALDYSGDVREHFLENVFSASLRYQF